MFRAEFSKLTRRILVLAVLLTGLAVASSGVVESRALSLIPCCQCWTNFDNCLLGCSDQACIDACNVSLERCHRFCEPSC
jgi:hypothetical protein